jgi:hypothetical protein
VGAGTGVVAAGACAAGAGAAGAGAAAVTFTIRPSAMTCTRSPARNAALSCVTRWIEPSSMRSVS